MKTKIKNIVFSSLTTLAITLPALALANAQTPKNIIMVVADGMGPAYTTAYRYFKDDPNTEIVEQTVFDRHYVGSSSTFPHHDSGYVTDSAASATALAAGIKSYNGAIGVDANKQPVDSVLKMAKQQGMKTGVVVTSQINHATPASYLAHNESRRNYNDIADSYIDDGIMADVYLGGGWQYFIRNDRNLIEEFEQSGFRYINSYEQLNFTTQSNKLIGLFADKGLPPALDDSNPHRLREMTKVALKHLEGPQGFFILIEASQVDWAGHSNDIASAMAEMDDLAKTMELLEHYSASNPDTLVVLTADHSTGGLTIAANGKYHWQPQDLTHFTMSNYNIAKVLSELDITLTNVDAMLPFKLSQSQLQTLQDIKKASKNKTKTDITEALYGALNQIVDTHTNTGWTTSGHTAIDVPVFALGVGKERFYGHQDNTDIAKKIFSLLSVQ
ncbi:alkaline phosphatase [Thalassotalea aquiviva]|uniref:alkaline phosphatase n=1 Tax=Thalassotalea aquiviva TaxID=3242415 RepID=UPI00352B9E0B